MHPYSIQISTRTAFPGAELEPALSSRSFSVSLELNYYIKLIFIAISENLTKPKMEEAGGKDLGSSGPVYKGKQQDKTSEMAVIRHIQIHDQLESSITRLAFLIRQVGNGLVDFESKRGVNDIEWCRAYV